MTSAYTGMARHTGRQLDDVDHIRQSVTDILTTPLGSRIMRREYGSLLPDLIDHPGNPANRLRLVAATFMAIIRWEPRVRITKASVTIAADGRVAIDMEAQRRTGPRAGSALNLNVPLR